MVARMGGCEERLAASLHPLDRPPEALGEETERHVLRIEQALHTEPAADIGRHHADAILRQVEDVAKSVAHEMRDLRARPQRQLALGRVPVGEPAPALERSRRLPVGAERALHDHRGPGQRGIDIAVVEPAREQDVVACGLVHDCRVAPRLADVTPYELVTAIVTEEGVRRPPFR